MAHHDDDVYNSNWITEEAIDIDNHDTRYINTDVSSDWDKAIDPAIEARNIKFNKINWDKVFTSDTNKPVPAFEPPQVKEKFYVRLGNKYYTPNKTLSGHAKNAALFDTVNEALSFKDSIGEENSIVDMF